MSWISVEQIKGLVLHELGHSYLYELKKEAPIISDTNHFFRLFDEGFAEYTRYSILGEKSLELTYGSQWPIACKKMKSTFAHKFISQRPDETIKEFFGSSFNIDGISQAGHYLGLEIIKLLLKDYTLDEIIKMEIERCTELIKKNLTCML